MEIGDLSAAFSESSFALFRDAIAAGGEVRGFVVPGAREYSRRELDELVEQAKQLGAPAWSGRARPRGRCRARR